MSFSRSPLTRRTALAGLLTAAAVPLLAGCVQGEGSTGAAAAAAGGTKGGTKGGTLTLDFATYNPLSLIVKEKGWLEAALADQQVTVAWVQSAGSNKANEALRAGAIDVGSTAGSAALLARSNGSPMKTIDIFSQPEWAALVVPAGSPITSVEQLKGKQIAATTGTDPYFFLVQAIEAAGLGINDVTVQNLQHADGWAALQNGSVDAWAGLDPIMAGAEAAGATLLYRNVAFNSYGLLNATESFLAEKPDLAQTVVNAYEHARAWALENQNETASILASVAGLDVAVATTVITQRSNLDVDHVPGSAQTDVLAAIGPIFVENGDVASQQQVDEALDALIDDTYATAADPSAIGA
ncbi:aliphatic sulfonate ABC transporter substrate-binding protein [Rathayibacter agropyri]|uniref:aliphatic sulfonate ABC transporter substrate-binding protein n=1 Tax=Rathayibacter agropyri TaxID=1634927 RepID=UPI00156594AE|nr:aliphatic sulfonate ABC transporter substrate-binding protein [Rathayibacter agropyri]NRD09095.1 aliphatic sulfonate ABC transporter substrate-binding protein [Rathayibacter agropyri]